MARLPEKHYQTVISANEIEERDKRNRSKGRAEALIGATIAAVLIKKRKRLLKLLKDDSKTEFEAKGAYTSEHRYRKSKAAKGGGYQGVVLAGEHKYKGQRVGTSISLRKEKGAKASAKRNAGAISGGGSATAVALLLRQRLKKGRIGKAGLATAGLTGAYVGNMVDKKRRNERAYRANVEYRRDRFA